MIRSVLSLVLGAALAVPVLPAAPALANSGSVSVGFDASTPEEAAALRLGLGIYAIHRGADPGAVVAQMGSGHAAGVGQTGAGHTAVVHQEGCDQTGTVSQTGANNAYGLFQFGCGGTHHASQSGTGQAGVTVQYSW
jgi:predicted secreted protein